MTWLVYEVDMRGQKNKLKDKKRFMFYL